MWLKLKEKSSALTFRPKLTGGGKLKPGEYVCISNAHFPFFKMFLIKNKNENDWGNGGFIDVIWIVRFWTQNGFGN